MLDTLLHKKYPGLSSNANEVFKVDSQRLAVCILCWVEFVKVSVPIRFMSQLDSLFIYTVYWGWTRFEYEKWLVCPTAKSRLAAEGFYKLLLAIGLAKFLPR